VTDTVTDVEQVVPPGKEVARFQEAKDAERSLWIFVMKASLVAIPICIAIWVGLVALALAIADTDQGLGVPLAVAAGVGIVAGAFFGGWAGFLAKSHVLDEVDGRVPH
jgi:hypothetical protein